MKAYGRVAAILLFHLPASAHLVTTGLGPVYDGITHLLVSPEDLVPVLAAALLAGMNGPAAGRWALFAVAGGWLAGGLTGLQLESMWLPHMSVFASFLVLGSLVALDRRLTHTTIGVLCASLGMLHGCLNGASMVHGGKEALGLLGIVGSAFIIVAIGAAFVLGLRSAWARLAVRVAGSWVAAIGLLMAGWSLRASGSG